MQGVLRALVIDTESDHNTNDTAKRVAKMFLTEVFKGRYTATPAVTEFPNVARLNELMIVGPITVRSACSHHLCPILGKVWIGLLPNEHSNLIGLSKYARICDWIMSRPQIQEEAVTMLANELQERVKPDGLAIVMEADHFCMHWRGVKDDEAMMTNSVMRGAFLKDAEPAPRVPLAARQESRAREPTMLVRLIYASRAASSVERRRAGARSSSSRRSTTRRSASPACSASAPAPTSSCRCSRAAASRSARSTTASRRIRATATSTLLSYEEIGERSFASWSMGQVNMSRLNPALVLKYSEAALLDPYAVSGKASLALFNELVATASIGVQRLSGRVSWRDRCRGLGLGGAVTRRDSM